MILFVIMESMFHLPPLHRSADIAIRGTKIALLLALVSLAPACGRKAESPRAELRHYEVRGVVRGLPPDPQTIEVEHEAIPDFMPAMTMPFVLRDKNARAALKPGDAISFRLNLTAEDSWIDQIEKVDPSAVHLFVPPGKPEAPRQTSSRLREGDILPAFRLVDQDGKKITNESFRGHPLVLTFLFTRCPIPNFCPLMSKNFAELQRAIKDGAGAIGQTKLLSISFDFEFDTPLILKKYAEAEQADPARWSFATGEKSEIETLTRGFSVLVQPEAGTISHSLATALIDRDGRIQKIWRGNAWKPAEVLSEIEPPR